MCTEIFLTVLLGKASPFLQVALRALPPGGAQHRQTLDVQTRGLSQPLRVRSLAKDFTTIRIQKFASSVAWQQLQTQGLAGLSCNVPYQVNFNGTHRTLPVRCA